MIKHLIRCKKNWDVWLLPAISFIMHHHQVMIVGLQTDTSFGSLFFGLNIHWMSFVHCAHFILTIVAIIPTTTEVITFLYNWGKMLLPVTSVLNVKCSNNSQSIMYTMHMNMKLQNVITECYDSMSIYKTKILTNLYSSQLIFSPFFYETISWLSARIRPLDRLQPLLSKFLAPTPKHVYNISMSTFKGIQGAYLSAVSVKCGYCTFWHFSLHLNIALGA